MDIPLSEIAKLLESELIGDGSVQIKTISGVGEAEEGHLTFIIDPKYIPPMLKVTSEQLLE